MATSALNESNVLSPRVIQINHREKVNRVVQEADHAKQCLNPNCDQLGCNRMKRILLHMRSCNRKTQGGCRICKCLIICYVHHAKHCNNSSCPLFFCAGTKFCLSQRTIGQVPPPMSRNFANLPRPTLVFGRTFRGVFTSPSVEERNSLNELRTVIERLVVLRNQRQAQSGVSQVANQLESMQIAGPNQGNSSGNAGNVNSPQARAFYGFRPIRNFQIPQATGEAPQSAAAMRVLNLLVQQQMALSSRMRLKRLRDRNALRSHL